MTRNHPRISAMERDISTKHWLPNDEGATSYTWHNLKCGSGCDALPHHTEKGTRDYETY